MHLVQIFSSSSWVSMKHAMSKFQLSTYSMGLSFGLLYLSRIFVESACICVPINVVISNTHGSYPCQFGLSFSCTIYC